MKIKNVKVLRLDKLDLVDDIIENITTPESVNIILSSDVEKPVGKATNIKIVDKCLTADLEIVDKKAIMTITKRFNTTAAIGFITKKFKIKDNIRTIQQSELKFIDICTCQAQEEFDDNLIKTKEL